MALLSAERFWERLRSGLSILSDGAIGSELIEQGIAPADLLRANQQSGAIVRSLHQAYIAAGAHFITSNTFGAGPIPNRLEECRAGAEIALKAALDCDCELGVWLSFPPCAIAGAQKSLQALIDAASIRPPMILIETCTSLAEARSSARIALALDPQILAVTGHFHAGGMLQDGTTPEQFVRALESEGAHVVGANCGETPEAFVELAARMRSVTSAPLLMQPSAGLPTHASRGKWRYPVGPERFARAAARMVAVGADIVGGCCGTTPNHIAAAASVLRLTDGD